MICGCGQEDCRYAELGYPFCTGTRCNDHHRPPVATEDRPWCPIEQSRIALDVMWEGDDRGEDIPWDHANEIAVQQLIGIGVNA